MNAVAAVAAAAAVADAVADAVVEIPAVVDLPVILSRQEQEYLLHVLESAPDLHDLRQLFLWAQGQLQAVLPHRALVCLATDGAGEIVRSECLHGGQLPAALMDALAAPDGPAGAVLQRWRRAGCRPLALRDGEGDEAGRLAALGLPNALAHGSAAPGGSGTFFLLCGLPQRPGARQMHFLRLLLPYLHMALQRIGAAPARAVPPATRDLSLRETQVLRWLREGKSNDEIGQILGISALTVKNHLQRLYRVLGASNRAHAVARSAMLAFAQPGLIDNR